MKFRSVAALAASSALAVTLGVAPAQAHNKPEPSPSPTQVRTLATGLGGPLRVAFGPHGSALVAESQAGKLTKVYPSGAKRTLVNAPGYEIAGVSYARGITYYFQNALGETEGPPTEALPALLKTRDSHGRIRTVTDLTEFEKKHNPDGRVVYGVRHASASCLAQAPELRQSGEVYSHPYSSEPTRHGLYVADAGANAILHVNKHGRVHVVKVLPAESVRITPAVQDLAAQMGIKVPDCMLGLKYYSQAVPTDIEARGNWLYYTVLPGSPGEALSKGKVYRLNLHTHRTEQLASGISGATGLDLDRKGGIYVTEIFGAGIAKIVHGKPVTVLPASSATDVEIKGTRLLATTDAFAPAGKLVSARIR